MSKDDTNKAHAELKQAMQQAEERFIQGETAHAADPSSKAEAAIKKLREDRRLTKEELDAPMVI